MSIEDEEDDEGDQQEDDYQQIIKDEWAIAFGTKIEWDNKKEEFKYL